MIITTNFLNGTKNNWLYVSFSLVTEIEYVIKDGDTLFSICSYVAETDEAINLVEGERVYLIGKLVYYLIKYLIHTNDVK